MAGTPFDVAVVDMDDTLLGSDGAVSPRTLAAIEAWLGSGRRLVIATGRPPRSIGTHLPAALHEAPWICYNGAEIRLKGKIVYQNYIAESALCAPIGRVLEKYPDCTIGIELEDALWLNRQRHRQSEFSPHYHVVDLRTVYHRSTPKVLFFSERLPEVMALVSPPPAGVRIMESGRYPFFQLMAQGADKSTALVHLMQEWSVPLGRVVAFGDDVNDVDLLRVVGLGIAMENAYPPARAAADRLTAHHDADGVALVLEELLAEAAHAVPSPTPLHRA